MKRWIWSVAVLAAATAGAAIVACTGDTGPQGQAGPPGASGAPGPTGPQGPPGTSPDGGGTMTGEAGGPQILSGRAQHGIEISPVPLNLGGKTDAQLEMIGNGSYIVNALGSCADCHGGVQGGKGYLAGGTTFDLGGGNSVTTRNLTSSPTGGMTLTEDQFITAMRTGADFQGVTGDAGATKSLIVMPWMNYRWLSTYDLKSIYAFLKAIPAVANTVNADAKPAIPPTPFTGSYDEGQVTRPLPPETSPDPNAILRGLAEVPLDIQPPADPTQLSLYGRGSYLVNAAAACNECHSNPERTQGKVNFDQYLGGGRIFTTPPPLVPIVKTVRSMSSNLSGKGHGYFNQNDVTFQTWLVEITQGVHADMPAPQPPLAWPMPAATFRNMTIDDLEAVYVYVKAVAASAQGNNPAITADKETQDAARACSNDSDCLAALGEKCSTSGADAGGQQGECIGRACTKNSQCDACQTCDLGGTNKCIAPADPTKCTGL